MNETSLRGKAAIIGIGQSPVGKVPGRSPLWLAADAGIDPGPIEALMWMKAQLSGA